VVVDDGSGEAFEPIFAAVPDFAVLLRHEVNKGKGAALKTAITYVLEQMPQCELALTADADGQHRYEDIVMVNDAAKKRPNELVLGSRKFDGDVPFRSRFGNGVTRQVFAIASGQKVYDTQTGLRVFGRAAMQRFLKVPGDRYEYEINMLLDAAQAGIRIHEETIATVYLNDNSSSHFNPFKDSIKIYMCILKFCFSSLLAFVIDYLLVLLFSALTIGLGKTTSLAVSVIAARLISSAVNFTVNRSVVFKGNESLGRSAAKYAALAVFILAANLALMYVLNIILGWPVALAKILVEVLLFAVSFVVQGKVVYREGKK
jgi:glycosyltransferase involved in cell wall biosynthesis